VDLKVRRRQAKRHPGRTRLSRKNQVTIPVAALAEAQVRPGDELRVVADGRGRLVLIAVNDPLEDLIGSAPGLSAATDLERLRDEWDR
jgi:hypothetical protein